MSILEIIGFAIILNIILSRCGIVQIQGYNIAYMLLAFHSVYNVMVKYTRLLSFTHMVYFSMYIHNDK